MPFLGPGIATTTRPGLRRKDFEDEPLCRRHARACARSSRILEPFTAQPSTFQGTPRGGPLTGEVRAPR